LVSHLLSLGWQAATFFLSGSRVRVSLLRGAIGRGNRVLMPAKGWGEQQRAMSAAQGIGEEVVAIEVRNRGRLAINVEVVNAWFGPKKTPAGFSLPEFPGNEPFPHRLEPGSSGSWAMPLARMLPALAAFGQSESELYMSAGLGNGKTVRTKERTIIRAKRDAVVPPQAGQ
jgi:hypothetical protein